MNLTRKQLLVCKEMAFALAMFFLPFGYDFLFKLIMNLAGSYWIADITFYGISALFWILYILLKRKIKKSGTD